MRNDEFNNVGSEDNPKILKESSNKDNINDILKLAKKVEQAINERLNGKNSNVYDILGIMKPIESEPSHLFSPHMYNQSNKTKCKNMSS